MTVNENLFMAPRDTFTVVDSKRVTTSNATTAAFHSLYATLGYVGPYIQEYPPRIHAFNYYKDRVTCLRQYYRAYGDPQGNTIIGNGNVMAINPSSVTFDPPLNYNGVYARALDKLNEQVRGNLDLSVDFAEYKQVHRMLKLQDKVTDYTKTFFKRKFGLIRAIANARLEYMYGVKPLLSSVFGAADEILRRVYSDTKSFRVRASDTGYKVKKIGIQLYYGPEQFDASNVRIKLSCTLGIRLIQHDHDAARFMSLNPASIAWELMPYSFVVDWFLGVGDYLRNMETYLLYNNDFLSGYRSDLAAFSGSAINADKITSYPPGTDSRSCNVEGLRFNRTVLYQYPTPNKPQLQADLGSSRLLNGAALLAQFLGGQGIADFVDPAEGRRARDKQAYRDRVNNSRNIRFPRIIR